MLLECYTARCGNYHAKKNEITADRQIMRNVLIQEHGEIKVSGRHSFMFVK